MANRESITQAYLHSILHYDPGTGIWTWLTRPIHHFKNKRTWAWWNSRYAGKQAKSLDKAGYVVIHIDKGGRVFKAHQLAFLYMEGKIQLRPDHRNNNKSDCKWENLRVATRSQNGFNRKLNANNKSGYKGVSWVRSSQKWSSRIQVNKKSIFLGYFQDLQEAVTAYREAATHFFGEFCRFN